MEAEECILLEEVKFGCKRRGQRKQVPSASKQGANCLDTCDVMLIAVDRVTVLLWDSFTFFFSCYLRNLYFVAIAFSLKIF